MHPIYYFPIITTVICIAFSITIFQRYRKRGSGNHLLWWSGGVLVYGLGTLAAAWMTLIGWSPLMFKFWYIMGALMGGAPLATGTVWLLLKPRTARKLTSGVVLAITIAAVCVILSPVNPSAINPHLPTGRALQWQWVRAFSPFINSYAVIFLVGGAILSAWRFRKHTVADQKGVLIARDRFMGNVYIAIGAMLPGIGGVSSRAGYTQLLYVTELIGIILIWLGYWYNVRRRAVPPLSEQTIMEHD